MFASKPLFSALALVLALGVSVPAAAEPPHGRYAGKAHKAKKAHKLHPACKKYLDRRAKWYRLKGDKAELRENERQNGRSASCLTAIRLSNAAQLTRRLMISTTANSAVNRTSALQAV